MVDEAKIEVDAFINRTLIRAGLEKLNAPLTLPAIKNDENEQPTTIEGHLAKDSDS